jgi:L-ascorbate metabolism protein UlaG (beta-lactamase superfamily)
VVSFALPEVMGSVLEFHSGDSGRAVALYVTGDTLAIDDLAEIPRRHPHIDLALLHLGGTRVMGILLTMDGEQGVKALRMVRPAHAIPIHHDDYDVFNSPLSDFQASVRAAGLEHVVRYLDRGQTYTFDALPVR